MMAVPEHKAKQTGVWMFLMSLFIMELLFYTWCRVQNVNYGYEITKGTQDQGQLTAYQNNLKIELARLKAPDRIARIAEKQLGMIKPSTDRTIVLP
jgi:cell division protein FtsL